MTLRRTEVDTSAPGGGSTLTSAQKVLRVYKELQRVPSLSVTQVADLIGVSPSSAHRILTTLVTEGFARQQEDGRKYEVALPVVDVDQPTPTNVSLRSVAYRHLQAVSGAVRAQVWLIHLGQSPLLIWDLCHGGGPPLVTPDMVAKRPAHSMASGKVLLSALTPWELNLAYPQEELPGCTARTITSKRRLLSELDLIRKHGYAVQINESLNEVSAVAVPVVSTDQRVIAALAITGPTDDYTRPAVHQHISLALEAAGRIEADLGAIALAAAPQGAE